MSEDTRTARWKITLEYTSDDKSSPESKTVISQESSWNSNDDSISPSECIVMTMGNICKMLAKSGDMLGPFEPADAIKAFEESWC